MISLFFLDIGIASECIEECTDMGDREVKSIKNLNQFKDLKINSKIKNQFKDFKNLFKTFKINSNIKNQFKDLKIDLQI